MSLTRMTLRPSVSTSCLSRTWSPRAAARRLRLALGELGAGDAQQHARLLEAGHRVPGRRTAALPRLTHEGGHARVRLPGADDQVVQRAGGLALDVAHGAAEQLAQVEHRLTSFASDPRGRLGHSKNLSSTERPAPGGQQRSGAPHSSESFSTAHRRDRVSAVSGKTLIRCACSTRWRLWTFPGNGLYVCWSLT